MPNLKDALMSQFSLGVVEKNIPGFDDPVFIKKLSSAEVENFEVVRMNVKTGAPDFSKYPGTKAALIYLCLCDEDGAAIFDSAKEINSNMSSEFVDLAHQICQEVNHMGGKEEDDARGN